MMEISKKLKRIVNLSKEELEKKYKFSEEKKHLKVQNLKLNINKRFDELENELLILLLLYEDNDITQRLTGTKLNAFRTRVRKYLNTDKSGNNFFDKDIKQELNRALSRRITIIEALTLEIKALLNIVYHDLEQDFDLVFSEIYLESYNNNKKKTLELVDKKHKKEEKEADLEKTWRPNKLNHRDLLWGDMRQLMVDIPKAIKYSKFRNEDTNTTIEIIDKKLSTKNKRANRNLETDAEYFFILAQQKAFNDLEILTVTFSTMNDIKVCSECNALSGLVIAVDELVPYDNAPPVHDNCRCFVIPNFTEDWLSMILQYED